MTSTKELNEGDYVIYGSLTETPEMGVVKSIQDDQHVFVVYKCNGEWANYRSYTAQRTNINNLIKRS